MRQSSVHQMKYEKCLAKKRIANNRKRKCRNNNRAAENPVNFYAFMVIEQIFQSIDHKSVQRIAWLLVKHMHEVYFQVWVGKWK